ncbi:MAG: histidine kinase [Phycisphaerales bacterium]|nr:histidine kinase [Phycisphaerales bacterium]
MRANGTFVPEETYPELATAMRLRSDRILQSWEGLVRRADPCPAAGLDVSELRDHLPEILGHMADTFETASARDNPRMPEVTPSLGTSRFRQKYHIGDVLAEDRLLRRSVIEHVDSALCRPMLVAENIALNSAVDLVVQQEVLAYRDCEKDESKDETEGELKRLSFYVHEMNNNLNVVGLRLRLLRDRLAPCSEFAEDVAALDEMQHTIRETAVGMRHFQEYERLRESGVTPEGKPVRLHDLAAALARWSAREAASKGLNLVVEVSPDAQVISDHALIAIVMRNLVGNAIKYSSAGTVHIRSEYGAAHGQAARWTLAVSDEGPGIGPAERCQIFHAFCRGEAHGQAGQGLGLAIASRAAKLIDAELSLESEMGKGSTFRLTFPPE